MYSSYSCGWNVKCSFPLLQSWIWLLSSERPVCIVAESTRGGHSHTRNAFGRDRGHKVVTETLAIFLVVTGSQDISGSGHGVTGIFLGAVCIILISDSCHSIQAFSGSAHLQPCKRRACTSDYEGRTQVGRVGQASALKRVRLGALSARPAPLLFMHGAGQRAILFARMLRSSCSFY